MEDQSDFLINYMQIKIFYSMCMIQSACQPVFTLCLFQRSLYILTELQSMFVGMLLCHISKKYLTPSANACGVNRTFITPPMQTAKAILA